MITPQSIRASGVSIHLSTYDQIERAKELVRMNPSKYATSDFQHFLYYIAESEESDRVEKYVRDGIGERPQ